MRWLNITILKLALLDTLPFTLFLLILKLIDDWTHVFDIFVGVGIWTLIFFIGAYGRYVYRYRKVI